MAGVSESWARLSPQNKRMAVIGGAAGLFLLIAGFAMSGGEEKKPRNNAKVKPDISLLSGAGDARRFSAEQQQAQITKMAASIDALSRQLQTVQSGGGRAGGVQPPFPVVTEASPITGVTADVSPPSQSASSVTPQLAPAAVVAAAINGTDPRTGRPTPIKIQPNPNGRGPTVAGSPGAGKNADVFGGQGGPASTGGAGSFGGSGADGAAGGDDDGAFKIRTTRSRTEEGPRAQKMSYSSTSPQTSQQSAMVQDQGDQGMVLPMGSMISGTLLTGMQAPTGAAAKKDPFPTVLRIKHEAILPNLRMMDLRECFIVAAGFGDLSSSRVHLRSEGLSCIRADGAVLDAQLDAYASGSDGHAGIRGVIIEKTGQIVSRSLLAGVFGGVANAMKPQQSQGLAINPVSGSTASYQYPSAGYVAGNGLLTGASEAGGRIAQIYEDLAKQALPVVEIDAGVPVDFVVTRSVVLRFRQVGEFNQMAARARGNQSGQSARQAQGTRAPGNSNMNGINVTPGASTSSTSFGPQGAGTGY